MRYLLVEDVAQRDDRRPQHEVNHTASLTEGIVRHIQCHQEDDQLDNRHQHGMHERVKYRHTHPAVDLYIDQIEADDEHDREDLAVEEVSNHSYLRLLSI